VWYCSRGELGSGFLAVLGEKRACQLIVLGIGRRRNSRGEGASKSGGPSLARSYRELRREESRGKSRWILLEVQTYLTAGGVQAGASYSRFRFLKKKKARDERCG